MKARRPRLSSLALPLLAVVAVALAIIWFYLDSRRPQLELGVGYAARVACACRYIGNRDLASCRQDFEPGMEAIGLSDEPTTRTVTASVPLVASRAVRFDPLLGCQPEAFKGTPIPVAG